MTAGWACAVLLALGAAGALWSPSGSLTSRRLRALGGAGGVRRFSPAPTRPGRAAAARRHLFAAAAGGATALLLGGAGGMIGAVVVGLVTDRLLRRHDSERTGERERRRDVRRELPAACDLLAVCLAAGVPVSRALAAVAGVVPGPLGAELSRAAALYRLGAPVAQAWSDVPRECAALGRILVRAGESGSSVLPALRSLSAEERAAVRAESEAAVGRAGVWLLAPLGSCFLPAFVCLGIVPVVVGIAGQVFR